MIDKLEKFFCIAPLLLALLCTSFVNGQQVVPQKDTLRQEASDCIEKIRQKQYKIKQEIGKIKELIKDTSQDQIPKGKP